MFVRVVGDVVTVFRAWALGVRALERRRARSAGVAVEMVER